MLLFSANETLPPLEIKKVVVIKSHNYVIAPNRIPKLDIIFSVKTAITKFDKKTAEEIFQEVSRILRTSRLSRKNLSDEEHQTMRTL